MMTVKVMLFVFANEIVVPQASTLVFENEKACLEAVPHVTAYYKKVHPTVKIEAVCGQAWISDGKPAPKPGTII